MQEKYNQNKDFVSSVGGLKLVFWIENKAVETKANSFSNKINKTPYTIVIIYNLISKC